MIRKFLFFSGILSPALAEAAAAPASTSGFYRYFVSGGVLVWLILLPLSILTVTLIVKNYLTLRRKNLIPDELAGKVRRLGQGGNFAAVLEQLRGRDIFYTRVLLAGLTQVTLGKPRMDQAMQEALEQEANLLLRKIEWLNLIGNVGPMIGLFGTVWGMIENFNAIVATGGQPQPTDMASGISVALVATWWGLVIAIPALFAHGALRNRVDAVAAEMVSQAEQLLRFLPGEKELHLHPEAFFPLPTELVRPSLRAAEVGKEN